MGNLSSFFSWANNRVAVPGGRRRFLYLSVVVGVAIVFFGNLFVVDLCGPCRFYVSLFSRFAYPSGRSFCRIKVFFLLVVVFVLKVVRHIDGSFFCALGEAGFNGNYVSKHSDCRVYDVSLILVVGVPFFVRCVICVSVNLIHLPCRPCRQFSNVVII